MSTRQYLLPSQFKRDLEFNNKNQAKNWKIILQFTIKINLTVPELIFDNLSHTHSAHISSVISHSSTFSRNVQVFGGVEQWWQTPDQARLMILNSPQPGPVCVSVCVKASFWHWITNWEWNVWVGTGYTRKLVKPAIRQILGRVFTHEKIKLGVFSDHMWWYLTEIYDLEIWRTLGLSFIHCDQQCVKFTSEV